MQFNLGERTDTFAGTPPLTCVKLVLSRAASIQDKDGEYSRVLARHDIFEASWHANLPESEPIAVYLPKGEEDDHIM